MSRGGVMGLMGSMKNRFRQNELIKTNFQHNNLLIASCLMHKWGAGR